jgi:hypothetical protein
MGCMHGIKWVCIVVGGMHGIKYVEGIVFTYFLFFLFVISLSLVVHSDMEPKFDNVTQLICFDYDWTFLKVAKIGAIVGS